MNYNARQMEPNQNAQTFVDPLNIQLTMEERKVLKECQYNATVLRGLPLGAFTITTFYMLMKKKILKTNIYSLALSGITGFVIGTISYRQICIDKLLALPNSTLKERILIAQGQQPHVRVDIQSQDGQSQSWFDSNTFTEQTPMTSSLNIEPYNETNHYNDYASSPMDAETAYAIDPPLEPIVGTPYTTYDDLRRNNREQYENSRNPGFRAPAKNNPWQQQSADPMRQQPIDPQSSQYDNQHDSQRPRRIDDFLS